MIWMQIWVISSKSHIPEYNQEHLGVNEFCIDVFSDLNTCNVYMVGPKIE